MEYLRNVLSALIQNFDTVEKVIETSANSAGSALKENERYLDSIQGKIDQFNNATQAMWSNTLNSDMVKGFVNLGTELVKIIDKVGLIKSALLAFGAFKGFGALFKSLKADGVTLKSVWQWINQLTLATRAQQVADAAATGTTLSRINAEKLLNLSIVKRFGTEQIDAKVKEANRLREVALVAAKEALALAEEQYAAGLIDDITLQTAKNAVDAASIPITSSQIGVTAILSSTFKGLAISIWGAVKAIVAFLFTNPIGWIILATTAIIGAIAAWNKWGPTTENLTEKLNDLKSELSDVRSELDSVNSELKTTQERMAELLAMDSLTFEEQEELDRLRATNDELERRKKFLEDEEKHKSELVGRQAARVVNSVKKDGFFVDNEDYIPGVIKAFAKDKELLSTAKTPSRMKIIEKDMESKAEIIDEYILTLSEALDGVEYGDSKESDKALDYLAELQDTYGIARGSSSAKTNAIKGLLNKDEFAKTKVEIDGYVDALAKGDTSAAGSIANIIRSNQELVKDLKARGLDAQDAIDYFTKLGSEANYATLDGKIKEVSNAAINFKKLLNEQTFNVDGIDTGLVDLFDKEGKIIQTKLSQVFQGTSDQTREDITSLLEGSYDQIKNGTVDVEKLLSGFALKTTQQVIEIQNKVLGEQNLELFPNLKDEIDGIIDKFNEFSTAVGSVVEALDTLEQARAEEAYSGSISIETLENLMKYTDDYTQLVEIDETGAIRLAADAEKILIGQRIEKIKTDATAAVQTAQSNLEQAKYNAKAVNETGPVQEALTSVTDGLAGSWAYLGSIIGDITDGNFSGIFERASSAYSKVTAGREEKRAQVNVSVEDAEAALTNALNQQKIANALTSDNVKSKYSSEEASGGADDPEEVKENAIDEAMERFQKEMDYWENRIAANQARYEQLQNEIDLLEAKGQKADASYYEKQIELENERLSLLQQQKAEAQSFLGTFAEGSDEWFRKKPAWWETYKRIPLNCWDFLRALYTTTQG